MSDSRLTVAVSSIKGITEAIETLMALVAEMREQDPGLALSVQAELVHADKGLHALADVADGVLWRLVQADITENAANAWVELEQFKGITWP